MSDFDKLIAAENARLDAMIRQGIAFGSIVVPQKTVTSVEPISDEQRFEQELVAAGRQLDNSIARTCGGVLELLRGGLFDLDEDGRVILSDEVLASVCQPFDANGWYEIGLMRNGEMFYNEDAGYSDVCRFETMSDVTDELDRLIHFFT